MEQQEVAEIEQPVYMFQYWTDPTTQQPCQMMLPYWQ